MVANETYQGQMIELMRTLRQVRQFAPGDIPEEQLHAILNVGRWSGSAANKQPWHLIVVRDRETLQRLAAATDSAQHAAGAAAAIVIVLDRARTTETFDEGRLVERLMLAARVFGIDGGVGMIGDASHVQQVRQVLGIPEDKTVHMLVSLGYPAHTATSGGHGGRKPFDEVVFFDRYGGAARQA